MTSNDVPISDVHRSVAQQISDEIGSKISAQYVANLDAGCADPNLMHTFLANSIRSALNAAR